MCKNWIVVSLRKTDRDSDGLVLFPIKFPPDEISMVNPLIPSRLWAYSNQALDVAHWVLVSDCVDRRSPCLAYALAMRKAVGLNFCTSGWLDIYQQESKSIAVKRDPLVAGKNPAHVGSCFLETS